MNLDIAKIGRRPVALDRKLVLTGTFESGPELLGVEDVHLVGTACRGQRGVDLSGHLDARLRLQCSRCLEPIESSLSTDFCLTIVPPAVEFGPLEAQVEEPDTTLFYAEEGGADLRAVALEQIYLNLPLKPVCSPDCRGFCPTCGANRNKLQCGCRQEEPDPRLAPLMQLKKRMRDS